MLSTKLPTIWQLYCTYSKINHFHETISGKTVDKLIQRCQPSRINQIPTKTKRTTPRRQSQDTTRQKTPHNSFKLSHVEFLTRWRPQTNSETPHTWSQLKSNQPTMTNTPRPTRPLPYIQATGTLKPKWFQKSTTNIFAVWKAEIVLHTISYLHNNNKP